MSKKSNKWQKIAEASKEQEKAHETKQPESEPESHQEADLTFVDRSELENQLTANEKALFELKDEFKRLQAEMLNQSARHERAIEKAHKFGNEKLIGELLPVIDSLQRGLEGADSDDAAIQNLRHGMRLTLDLFEKTLKKFGVEVIDPQRGDAFDPEKHEAMSMQPDPEAKPDTVLEVFQSGYALNGRVLRAAMVMVAQ